MDNREFNVSGCSKKELALALKCLLTNERGELNLPAGWYFDEKKGFVMVSYKSEHSILFTNKLGQYASITEEELVDTLWNWIHSLSPIQIEKLATNKLDDEDVKEKLGWRLYMDEWGCIERTDGGADYSSVAAFIPFFCWYGK